MSKLMPKDRLAEIIADAATRAAKNVTGIFRNERMTWTEQGLHASAWNAVMHDEKVQNALRMVEADGAADYAAQQHGALVILPAPMLGLATTRQLLDELALRIQMRDDGALDAQRVNI